MIWLLAVGALVLVAAQYALLRRFESNLSSSPSTATAWEEYPPVAVILCARGSDPHLLDGLRQLARQDWPNYCVFVVTDSATDPAVQTLQMVARGDSATRLEQVVAEVGSTARSLKCNSLVRVCETLPPQFEIVALIDADVVPRNDWLRCLLEPMKQPFVGASFGIRWFVPPSNRIGTMVRALWNAAAIVQMNTYGIAWGGSLAIRRSELMQSGILERWKKSLFEDVLVGPQLNANGRTLINEGSALAVNSEESRLSDAIRWMSRQLLDVRLYHPRWWLVCTHAFATGAILAGLIVSTIASAMSGWLGLAAGYAAIFVALEASNAWLIAQIARIVKKCGRDDSRMEIALDKMILSWLLIPVTQVLHCFALLQAMFMRRVTWRGIEYELRGQEVHMREYRPFAEITDARASESSRNQSIG